MLEYWYIERGLLHHRSYVFLCRRSLRPSRGKGLPTKRKKEPDRRLLVQWNFPLYTRGVLGCLLGFWPSGPKPCGGNYSHCIFYTWCKIVNMLSFGRYTMEYLTCHLYISGGSRGGARGAAPPLFSVQKKKWLKEGKPTGQVNYSQAPSFAEGLDPPLYILRKCSSDVE